MAKKAMNTTTKPADKGQWKKVVGVDGYPYYINSVTEETTWDKPDDFNDDDGGFEARLKTTRHHRNHRMV